MELGTIQLSVVHLGDGALRVVSMLVEDIGDAAIYVKCRVHGHAHVLNGTVLAKDLADMVGSHVAC